MANPELSRLAARLFNQYKVPLRKGFDWATEIETADSEENLSSELREFLKKPVERAGSAPTNTEKQAATERVIDSSGVKVTKKDKIKNLNIFEETL